MTRPLLRPAANLADLRKATRELVDFETQGTINGAPYAVRVVNISPLGLMARTDEDIRKGDRLIVELPHLSSITAIVRWVEDGRIGTEFVRPINDRDYAPMLAVMPRRLTAW
ncbi:hypothetical protein BH10PSE12_BH10PSE12_24770 [soil metagenome]